MERNTGQLRYNFVQVFRVQEAELKPQRLLLEEHLLLCLVPRNVVLGSG